MTAKAEGVVAGRRRTAWTLAGFVIAVLALSGCVSVAEIDPESQYFTTASNVDLTPRPYLKQVTIKNGAGETLYDGDRFRNPLSYDPQDPKLDGKLTITRRYSDGTVKEEEFSYTQGQAFGLKYDRSSGQYQLEQKPPLTTPTFYGGLKPAYQFLNRPDTPLVRQEQGGVVTGFVNGDNESNNPQFNGFVGFKMDQPFFGLGKKWGLELQGSYYTADSEEDRDIVPANGGNLAVFGPIGGGGFVTGNDIQNLRYTSDYTAWNIQPRFSKSYSVGSLYGRDLRMNSYMGFNFGKNEDDQELSGTVNGVGDFRTMNTIDDWYYGPEFGFYSAWDWCPRTKVTLGGFVNFNVNELSATRSLTSTFGQAGQDELDDTEYTVGGGVNLGLHHKLSDIITARVGFQYERQENTPVINVDQQTGVADVDAEGSDAYQFYVGMKLDY